MLEDISFHKGPPVMKEQERFLVYNELFINHVYLLFRYKVIKSIKWVDEVGETEICSTLLCVCDNTESLSLVRIELPYIIYYVHVILPRD